MSRKPKGQDRDPRGWAEREERVRGFQAVDPPAEKAKGGPEALSCSACKKRIQPDEDYILLQRILMTETSLSIGNRYYHVRHGATPRRRVAENPERWHTVLKKAGEAPT